MVWPIMSEESWVQKRHLRRDSRSSQTPRLDRRTSYKARASYEAPFSDALILQRHHGLFTLAEGGHALQAALRLLHDPHWSVAIHRMAAFGEEPAPAFAGVLRDGAIHRGTRGWAKVRTGHRQ